MFSARHRAGRHEEALTVSPVIAEQAYYGHSDPLPIIPHDRPVSRTDFDLRANTSLLALAHVKASWEPDRDQGVHDAEHGQPQTRQPAVDCIGVPMPSHRSFCDIAPYEHGWTGLGTRASRGRRAHDGSRDGRHSC